MIFAWIKRHSAGGCAYYLILGCLSSGFCISFGSIAWRGDILVIGVPGCFPPILPLSRTTSAFSSESISGLFCQGPPPLPPPQGPPPHQASRLLDASMDAVNKIPGIAFLVNTIVVTPFVDSYLTASLNRRPQSLISQFSSFSILFYESLPATYRTARRAIRETG